ncbi:trypsin-1-like [Oppia nitens]|uniref:trypsin-1-like n=1 Tax=Oppia nitens TaxID=1686743 RepID=UPI0023DBB570|nr:trypsin-1-like [Oppia nitens]
MSKSLQLLSLISKSLIIIQLAICCLQCISATKIISSNSSNSDDIDKNFDDKPKLFVNTDNCGLKKPTAAIDGYIIGGSEATAGQFPWQVSLQKRQSGLWLHTCGAVVLNKRWLLTAAHCINGLSEQSLRALVGTHLLNVKPPGTTGQAAVYRISKIIKHQDFSADNMANNLALIRLTAAINLDNSDGLINSVCLPNTGDKFTQYVTLSGWGLTTVSGSGGQQQQQQQPVTSNKLMFVSDVPIVSLPKCRSIYGMNWIREGMLCAGAPKGQQSPKGFCQGDNGGPLIQTDPNGRAILVGISSFNARCASPDGTPDVFVEISNYRQWIDKNAV